MSEGNSAAAAGSSGIGIFGLMFIVLFAGKVFDLGAVASWSWWWITAPLWGPIAAIFGTLFVVWVGAYLFGMTAKLFQK